MTDLDDLRALASRIPKARAAMVVELGVDLPAFGGVDAVLRQGAAGRIEAER